MVLEVYGIEGIDFIGASHHQAMASSILYSEHMLCQLLCVQQRKLNLFIKEIGVIGVIGGVGGV